MESGTLASNWIVSSTEKIPEQSFMLFWACWVINKNLNPNILDTENRHGRWKINWLSLKSMLRINRCVRNKNWVSEF